MRGVRNHFLIFFFVKIEPIFRKSYSSPLYRTYLLDIEWVELLKKLGGRSDCFKMDIAPFCLFNPLFPSFIVLHVAEMFLDELNIFMDRAPSDLQWTNN